VVVLVYIPTNSVRGEPFTLELSVGHQTNKGGNQKIHRIKQKWKHNLTEPLGHNKDSAKESL
jgi:mRNA-degrading endonuclease toxin of MazEF toxin-antitoxin module